MTEQAPQPKPEKTPEQINAQIARIAKNLGERANKHMDAQPGWPMVRGINGESRIAGTTQVTETDRDLEINTGASVFIGPMDSERASRATLTKLSKETGQTRVLRGGVDIQGGVGTARVVDGEGDRHTYDMSPTETVNAAARVLNKARAEVNRLSPEETRKANLRYQPTTIEPVEAVQPQPEMPDPAKVEAQRQEAVSQALSQL